MKIQLTPLLILTFFCASVFAAFSQQTKAANPKASSKAYEAGKAEARADIAKGLLIQKTYGLLMPGSEDYADFIRTKYKVQVKSVAGCIVTTEERDGVEGYNEVSETEIERRFGKGVLNQAAKDARKQYEQKIGAKRH